MEALIDSNIFIGLLRTGKDPAVLLHQVPGVTNLVTCGMVRLEVLGGMKASRTREKVAEFMDVMINVPSDAKLWEQAAEIAWRMRSRGTAIPNADAFIAASAMRVGAAVMSLDKHFSRIDGLLVTPPPKGWWK